ncbi:hypothetical protein B0H14DRAFT_2954703, partial [Mycena olivaceomarginata]
MLRAPKRSTGQTSGTAPPQNPPQNFPTSCVSSICYTPVVTSLFFYFLYRELLELKEIQQSLPHASQPADPLRPAKQLLSMVPIGLLPLAASDSTSTSSSSPVSPPPQSPPSSAFAPHAPFVMPPGRTTSRAPVPTRMASASLTHLRPPAPAPPRAKPAFAFLPLLATPTPESSAPSSPAGKVKADAGSYFPEQEYLPARSAADGEPDRVWSPPGSAFASMRKAIPIAGTAHASGGGYEHAYRAAEAAAYSPPFGSSLYDYKRDRRDMLGEGAGASGVASSSSSTGAAAMGGPSTSTATVGGKKKKKSFMFINDEVVEIEEDDDDDDELVSPSKEQRANDKATQTSPTPSALTLSLETDLKLPISPPLTPTSTSPAPSIPHASPTSPQTQTSPRLLLRPLSPSSPPRPVSPLSPRTLAASPAAAAGRGSPVQARASSRLV